MGVETLLALDAPVERGGYVLQHLPHVLISEESTRRLHETIAARSGHADFGLVVSGRLVADGEPVTIVRTAAELAADGGVFVGSPGSCPSCGSSDVALVHGDGLVRVCGGCGHRWSRFHPGKAA